MRRYRIFNITVTILASLLFIYLGIFHFSTSYIRFAETVRDLWNSIRFYFAELFCIPHTIPATVEEYSKVLQWNVILPETVEDFGEEAGEYVELLGDSNNFEAYLTQVSKKMADLAKISAILMPCILLFIVALKRIYEAPRVRSAVTPRLQKVFTGSRRAESGS